MDLQKKMDEFVAELVKRCQTRAEYVGLSGQQVGPMDFVMKIETTSGTEAYTFSPERKEWYVMYGFM